MYKDRKTALTVPNIDLSKDEQDLLQTPTMEALLYAQLLEAERHHRLTAQQVAETLIDAQKTAEQLKGQYDILTNPQNIITQGVDSETLQLLAHDLVENQERKETLSRQNEDAQRLSTMNYPTLKEAIMQVWQSNGGTPIPEDLIKMVEREYQGEGNKPEIYKMVMIVLGGVLTAPPVEEHIEYIEDTTSEELPVTEGQRSPRRFNIFSRWEEIFMDHGLAEDSAFVQNHRNSINSVIRKYPEIFADFGHPDNKDQQVNHKGAIEALDYLTVDQLNQTFDPNNRKTEPSAARIISLVLRLESKLAENDAFIPYTQLQDLANKIRSGEYDPETQLCEILHDEFSNIFDPNKPAEISTIVEPEIDEDKTEKRVFPTTDEAIVNQLVRSLQILYDDTAVKRGGRDFSWPLTSAQVQILLPRIKEKFVDDIYAKGFVTPDAPSGMASRRYSKLDVLKLITLYDFRNPGVKPREIRKALKKFDDHYHEALNRYKALKKQNQ